MEENHKIEILTPNGWKEFDGVLDCGESDTLVIEFEDGKVLECTEDHLLWDGNSFICARELYNGYSVDGNIVVDIREGVKKKVYDALNVRDIHSYYTNGLVSHNCLYVDETAFVPTKIAEEFFTSIFPTLSSSRTTQLILSSTPNGYNHFYDFWQGSINGTNDFVRFSITWDQVPGRDQDWYDEQLRLLGRIKFNQEVLCSFLGSSDTLIKPEALERHYNQAKSVTPIYESNEDEPYFTQFKKPKKNHVYFITVDTSKGGGGDYQVATVFDISKYPYEVVEVFRSNEIGDTEVPEIYYDLATKWNDAYLLIETNKSDKIAYSLWAEFEYENLLSVVKDGDGRWQLRHVDVSELGINTNKKIKKDGCSMARKLAEEDGIIINSIVLAKEMRTFVYKNGSFAAEETYNDDVMMTFVLFAWCTSQDFFKDISLKLKDEIDRIMESEEEEFVHRNVIFINDSTPTGIRQVDYGESMQLTPEEEFFFGHLIKRRR